MTLPPTLSPTIPLWINGCSHPLPEDEQHLFPVVSALTGRVAHHAVSATPAEALLAVSAASEAFTHWHRTSPAHRRTILLRAADVFERRAAEIAEIMVTETSCPKGFAEYNLKITVDHVRELAAVTSEIRGTVPQQDTEADGKEAPGLTIVVREAIGVILIIPPWNGAVILPTRAVTMALAAGCTAVFKASEMCPRTHRCIVEVFEEAGLPKGVLNQIQVRRTDSAAVTEAIIAHQAIRKVDFIGSVAVGRLIGQTCAKYLKPILMELGGKGPAIVLDDADLERAAHFCAMGATLHHGQLCFSTERIIVLRSVHDEFISHLKAAMHAIGPSAGQAVDEKGARHAHDMLTDAESHGADFLVGGPGYLTSTSLEPTIVTNVTDPAARIRDEETFGPSATLYVAETEDHAVAMANDSVYGLNAAVHTRSWERGLRVARRLEYGQVHLNYMTVGGAATWPVRGVKASGWGVSDSKWGIEEFLVEKTIAFYPTEGGGLFGV